jgi:excinuclease UvrABC helicase subunit UvrB
MYYHRYLSLFILGDFGGVIRDTSRNLRVLDLCGEFATDDHDRFILEQYRPYIIMMNTRATASLQFKDEQYQHALNTVTDGLDRIREFFIRFGQEEAFDKSNEVKILKRFARDIRRKLPIDPVEKLENKLQKAIKREDYEEAARLRDEIEVHRQRQGAGGA